MYLGSSSLILSTIFLSIIGLVTDFFRVSSVNIYKIFFM